MSPHKERTNHPQIHIPQDRALTGPVEYDPLKCIGSDYWEWKIKRMDAGEPSLNRELATLSDFAEKASTE